MFRIRHHRHEAPPPSHEPVELPVFMMVIGSGVEVHTSTPLALNSFSEVPFTCRAPDAGMLVPFSSSAILHQPQFGQLLFGIGKLFHSGIQAHLLCRPARLVVVQRNALFGNFSGHSVV